VDLHQVKIGVLGGGQLGKMLAQSASRLGLHLRILDSDKQFPAGIVCRDFLEGDFRGFDDVLFFGEGCDVITIEIEDVNLDALKILESKGKKIFPQPSVIEIIKDKSVQKTFYQEHQIPTAEFNIYEGKAEILNAIESGDIAIPFVQKAALGGYDGRGVQVVNCVEELELLMDTKSVIEPKVNIDKELAVIVSRDVDGNMKSFPMVEMAFDPQANLVNYLFCPSHCTEKQQNDATVIAENLASRLGIVGLLAVEMFLDDDGNILVNEAAPRPHNSGHHTIEACVTSQYEQHLRAILGLPLGETTLKSASVMVNLLGEAGYTGKARYQGFAECLELSGVYPHIYGKEITKPNRKMGHVTICDEKLKVALQKANFIKENLKVIS